MRSLVCSLVALIAASPACAADLPATQSGADRLLAIAGQFIGAEGTNSVVVTPEQDGYTVRVDMTRLLTPLEKLGIGLMSQYSQYLKLVEQDDSRWRVSVSEVPTVFGFMPGDHFFLLHMDDYRFRGIWDRTLASFTSWEQGWSAMRRSNTDKLVTSEVNIGSSSGSETGEAGGAGSVSACAHFNFGPFKQVVTSKTHAFTLTMAADAATSDVAVKSLRTTDHLDFWSYAVAHAGESASPDLEAFKGKVRAALPLFDRIDQHFTGKNMSLGTALGSFRAGALSAAWGTDGIVDGGSANVSLALDDFSAPEGAIPTWATRLVPNRFSMSEKVSGYDLAGAAKALIDSFDPSRKPPVSPDDLERIRAMVVARGPVHVRIDPTELRSPSYDLKVEGYMDFRTSQPEGKVTVHMTGLDQVLATVQAAKDPRAQQALMMLTTAKAFAKRENGGNVWVVGFQDGKVTINGNALSR